MAVQILTIGFTRKSARRFFTLLRESGAKRIIDVRLNATSQLAGFAKRDDLEYFAREICGIDCRAEPALAPTAPMLKAYRTGGDWPAYEREFLALLRKRRVEKTLDRGEVDGCCLLCSEEQPHHCHRRLVAEYLRDQWGDGVTITHLA